MIQTKPELVLWYVGQLAHMEMVKAEKFTVEFLPAVISSTENWKLPSNTIDIFCSLCFSSTGGEKDLSPVPLHPRRLIQTPSATEGHSDH